MRSNLYHPEILKLNEKPYSFKKFEDDNLWIIANNPFCGDRFKIFNRDEGNYYFYGHGCAVSKASTSLFVELLSSHNLEDMDNLAEDYIRFIQGDNEICPNSKLEIFTAVRHYPARQDCALLPWKAYLKWRKN